MLKLNLCMIILSLVISQIAGTNQLYPICKNGKCGYINSQGKIEIPLNFDETREFSEGLAVVGIKEQYGFLDTHGNIVISPTYAQLLNFSDGLAAATTCLYDCKWGYIDKKGNFLIAPQYDDIRPFYDGVALVYKNYKWLIIDRNGNELYKIDKNIAPDPSRVNVSAFSEGLAKIWLGSQLHKYGFIDKSGKVVIEPTFETIEGDFSDERALVKKDNKWGYIDKLGKMVIEPMFEDARPFSEGLARIKIKDKWGYIDTSGKIVIPPQFGDVISGLGEFSESLAAFQIEGKYGFINKEGKVVVKPKYRLVGNFKNGLARIHLPGKQVCKPIAHNRPYAERIGYINTKGEVIWEPTEQCK